MTLLRGRTLVPLPPWDVGFSHLFQPITNCSLKPGQSGADTSVPRIKPGQSAGDTSMLGQSEGDTSDRHELGEALAALTDMFLASVGRCRLNR